MGIGKLLLGLILVIIGLGLFWDSVSPIMGTSLLPVSWLANFIVVVTGMIPILLILLGLFLMWIQADDLKSKKDLATIQQPQKPAATETQTKK